MANESARVKVPVELPKPTIAIGKATAADGSVLAIVIQTAIFLEPESAKKLGEAILKEANDALIGLAVPPGLMLPGQITQ